jgi:hypothetical protein
MPRANSDNRLPGGMNRSRYAEIVAAGEITIGDTLYNAGS